MINDASCLNSTPISGIVRPASIDDIKSALAYARARGLKVTAAGARHSMGGQAFSRGGLVIDMRLLNHMELDVSNRTITVGAGATWHSVLTCLDARRLSVKAMQSISIFTVGGTLSVNAHGAAHSPGCVAATVRSLRVMLADATVMDASPTENADLFRRVLGGYGLFGIILDACLEVTDNELYQPQVEYLDYRKFPDYFAQQIEGKDNVGLMYAHLSMSPVSWLRETSVHTYLRAGGAQDCRPVHPDSHTRLERTVLNLSKAGSAGRWVRWEAERRFDAMLHCTARNQVIGKDPACTTSRNQEMDDQMAYLQNRLDDTDILQEYFLPHERFAEFVEGLRAIVAREKANLLNVTVRGVERDTVTALPYAPQGAFALVLYFNQALNIPACQVLERTTNALIDLVIRLGGRFYLPYQLYYSAEQLHAAYPEVADLFAAKLRYDPARILSNTFYERYSGA
jgi:FAD/FMN-containing dehydrogenase